MVEVNNLFVGCHVFLLSNEVLFIDYHIIKLKQKDIYHVVSYRTKVLACVKVVDNFIALA